MNDPAHIVLIADQVGSRRAPDAVPAALALLAGVDTVLPFERTAGEEIQGLLPDGAAAVRALTLLWRVGAWSIGVGIGAVEEPLPESTREARGGAYLAARRAIEGSSSVAARLRIGSDAASARDGETVLWLVEPLVRGRTVASWEALDLSLAGQSQAQIGERLGITQGAVSRRLARAYAPEVDRASELTARLLDIARRGC